MAGRYINRNYLNQHRVPQSQTPRVVSRTARVVVSTRLVPEAKHKQTLLLCAQDNLHLLHTHGSFFFSSHVYI